MTLLTLLWILAWAAGWVASYTMLVRISDDYPSNWDNSKRGIASFYSCLSWITIAVVILVVLIGLSILGIAWLCNRYIVPLLKKLEPKIEEEERIT